MNPLLEKQYQWYIKLGLWETIVIVGEYWDINYDEQRAWEYFDWIKMV